MMKQTWAICATAFLIVAVFGGVQIWVFSHQTFQLTGSVIEEDSEKKYSKIPGVTINAYRVNFADFRSFIKLFMSPVVQKRGQKPMNQQDCLAMFGYAASILTNQPLDDNAKFESGPEYVGKFAGEAVAVTGSDGDFSIRLRRGQYVLVAQKIETHLNEYAKPLSIWTDSRVWASYVDISGDSKAVITQQICYQQTH